MLRSEQPGSAIRELTRVGIRHGDTTEVEMVVGIKDSRLAFCPSVIRPVKVLVNGGFWPHLFAIRGDIVVKNADEVEPKLVGQTGFARMRGTVHTNGNMEFTIDPNSITVVSNTDEELVRKEKGKPLAEKILSAT